MVGTEYQKLLDAVAAYYGSGSDQWVTIATSSNIQSTEWAQILSSTPGVDVTYNNAGQVLSYSVNDFWGTATDAATAAVNSNTQVATLAGESQLAIPANTTIAQGSTAVSAESGLLEYSGGMTAGAVIKNVAIGVGAVAAGIKLGAAIDGLLYNANPDFWDENGMGAINPQTWDSIVGTSETGKAIFNMAFGINKNTGKTQAYIDERALAYIAQYMASKGAFDTMPAGGEVPADNPFDLEPFDYATTPAMFNSDIIGVGEVSSFDTPLKEYKIFFDEDDNLPTFATKTQPTGSSVLKMENAGGDARYLYITGFETYAHNGQTAYYKKTDWIGLNNPTLTKYKDGPTHLMSAAWLTLFGGYDGQTGVEGITQQTGATFPTGITPTMPLSDVITYLRNLYPELVTDSLTNDVVQPDGSVTHYVYVPVGFPDEFVIDADTGEITKPTGGTGTKQDQTEINPTDTPDETIETLIRILTATDPYMPTPPPPIDTDYPDTGDGSTPAIVTPTGEASALWSIYNPTQAEVNALGAWLWSPNFVDQLLKLFNDPMQAIIGLHKIFATPPVSGTGPIKVGYLNSGVNANLVSAQYTEMDCGTVSLREYFGNALDYTATDIYLYLPFIGIVPVSTVDVTRAEITVKYGVDVISGACLAMVDVKRDNASGGQLYTYAGNCAVQYPLSSGSYMGIVSSILGIAGSVAGTIATGGAMLPMALGAGAAAMGGARTKIEHSGSISGNAGAMGIKKPYFIIRRPQTKIAEHYNKFNGVSNNIYATLSSCSGYTRVKYINLETVPATGDELTEIENLLKDGVII